MVMGLGSRSGVGRGISGMLRSHHLDVFGGVEAPDSCRDEHLDEVARLTVVLKNLRGLATGDVQVAIGGAERHTRRRVQAAARGLLAVDKRVSLQRSARAAVVAQDLIVT